MRVKIYQINGARDSGRMKFMSLKENEIPDPSIYDEVFDAEMDKMGLEELYRQFNAEGHPLFRGHSMSVSDVVVTDGTAHICQSVGFREVPFNVSKAHKPDNLMRIVYVEPNKPPYEAEIEHTLEAEQRAVGGYIEPIYLIDEESVCLIGNEESKLMGMEGNRIVNDGQTVIAGPFFVVGLSDDDFRGLNDEEVMKYMDRFKEPEYITQEEIEADTGFTIISGIENWR